MINDEGIVSGLYRLAIALSPSHASENLAPYVSPKPGILSLSSSSSSLIPTTRRPLPMYLRFSSSSFGKDFLHGSQNVPQKSRRTTWPRSSFSEMVSFEPVMALTRKSGAGLPINPVESAAESAPFSASPHAVTETAIARKSAAPKSNRDGIKTAPLDRDRRSSEHLRARMGGELAQRFESAFGVIQALHATIGRRIAVGKGRAGGAVGIGGALHAGTRRSVA